MLNLQRAAMFIAVVEAGSFTAAAATQGQTKAVLSFNVRQLEAELGVALLLRTTRRLALTDAGETFYRRSRELVQEAQSLLHDVQCNHRGLTGELRITSTPEYGVQRVIPALAAFARLHPALRISHVSSSHLADLVSERFDVAIRLGTLTDSSYHAALIDHFSVLPVASPGWLADRPIASLAALAEAEWIIHRRLRTPLHWRVTTPDKQQVDFDITGPVHVSADSAEALMSFALAGSGVALLPAWLAAAPLAAGTLCEVLPGFAFPQQGIYALYPNTRHVPEKVRAFIDFLRTHQK